MTGGSQQGSPSIRLGRREVSDQFEPSWRVWEDHRLLAMRSKMSRTIDDPRRWRRASSIGHASCAARPLPYFLPHASPPGSASGPIPSVASKRSPLTPTCWAIDCSAAHSCAGSCRGSSPAQARGCAFLQVALQIERLHVAIPEDLPWRPWRSCEGPSSLTRV